MVEVSYGPSDHNCGEKVPFCRRQSNTIATKVAWEITYFKESF